MSIRQFLVPALMVLASVHFTFATFHPRFTVESADEQKPSQTFTQVVEVDFKTTNLKTSNEREFSVTFPVSGEIKNVPVKIVDHPRSSLQLELYLELSD